MFTEGLVIMLNACSEGTEVAGMQRNNIPFKPFCHLATTRGYYLYPNTGYKALAHVHVQYANLVLEVSRFQYWKYHDTDTRIISRYCLKCYYCSALMITSSMSFTTNTDCTPGKLLIVGQQNTG